MILAFLVYIPYSKHLHIITSSINVFLTKTKPMGKLTPLRIDLDQMEEEGSVGAATVTDLTQKQILDTFTCTECGRCQAVCPAWNTGKPLSPKLLIMNLRDHVFEQGERILDARADGTEAEPVPLNPNVVEDEVVWDCVTCGACMEECPVNIEHVDHIVDMRRNLVMGESRFPQKAGVPFAILGPRELCNGDPARRMGNEYLYQELVRENVSTLDGVRARKIVTTCPHC